MPVPDAAGLSFLIIFVNGPTDALSPHKEGSNGISQCGPAPLVAIKKGETFFNFETNFVYGEVNADRCTWLCEVRL